VLTESPYDDGPQEEWTDAAKLSALGSSPNITVFTNDRFSAEKNGWHLLAPAYDPAIHKPLPRNPELASDVLIIGTGWTERQMFLEAVDWSGIDFQIYGVWPRLGESPDSPIYKFYRPLVVNNEHAVEMYSSAKICLNFHRASLVAKTPGPRVFELAACGAFQLSDPRPDMESIFDGSVPTFRNPAELGYMVRRYLNDPDARGYLSNLARERGRDETFDRRAADMIAVLTGSHREVEAEVCS
jgi:spore maturation protein CgeB